MGGGGVPEVMVPGDVEVGGGGGGGAGPYILLQLYFFNANNITLKKSKSNLSKGNF